MPVVDRWIFDSVVLLGDSEYLAADIFIGYVLAELQTFEPSSQKEWSDQEQISRGDRLSFVVPSW